MDLIETVIDHISSVSYSALGQETVTATKTVILDTMGAAAAGSSGPGIRELVDLTLDWGGKPEGEVLVYGGRVPAFQAALVNCAMARAWELDEAHENRGGHLSSSLVPTAFIFAQGAAQKISGRELILAVAVGTDLLCRLRQTLKIQFGWVSETFAPFGVVAIASRLLGLSRELTLAAMGIAYAQASCNSQGTVDGALSVRLQQGLAAKAGVLAVRYAQIGTTGPRNILEGPYGLYPLYGRGQYDPSAITSGLGQRFEIVNTSLKPYPSCKHTHNAIAAVAKLVRDHAIAPEAVRQINVRTNRDAHNKCGGKRRPRSVVDAQFSIPFTAAVAALKGRVSLHDLAPETWESPAVLALADKVTTCVDPELDKLPLLVCPNIVEIETTSGKRYSERVDFVKGSPQNRMSFAECREKFQECVAFAARPIEDARAREFMDMAADLEHVEDVRNMAGLLVAGT